MTKDQGRITKDKQCQDNSNFSGDSVLRSRADHRPGVTNSSGPRRDITKEAVQHQNHRHRGTMTNCRGHTRAEPSGTAELRSVLAPEKAHPAMPKLHVYNDKRLKT